MGYLGLVFAIIFLGFFIKEFLDYRKYKQSEYFAITHNKYFNVKHDVGKYGEYLVADKLKRLSGNKKLLFNCYLPADDGKTSEIDVILIHDSGVYVFESKNYSGWIFGSETQKNWTQSLPNGRRSRKEHFFNPIMQNIGHIKWIKNCIGDEYPIHSIIVFSERCELKKIQLTSSEHIVIKRYDTLSVVSQVAQKTGACLSVEDIQTIFDKLYPYAQVDDGIKEQHIEMISNALGSTLKQESIKQEADVKITTSKMTLEAVVDLQDDLRCPKCGAQLIQKVAKKGERKGKAFYGCSNFPKCTYIQNFVEVGGG